MREVSSGHPHLRKRSWRPPSALAMVACARIQRMPLEHIALPGIEDGRGVHFPMMNGNTPVRVFLPRVTLQGEGAALGEGQYMARVDAFRDVYEAVARTKFETGRFKASLTLELTDIAQYLSGHER